MWAFDGTLFQTSPPPAYPRGEAAPRNMGFLEICGLGGSHRDLRYGNPEGYLEMWAESQCEANKEETSHVEEKK